MAIKKKKYSFSFLTGASEGSVQTQGQQVNRNSQATGRLSDPDPVYTPAPRLEPLPLPLAQPRQSVWDKIKKFDFKGLGYSAGKEIGTGLQHAASRLGPVRAASSFDTMLARSKNAQASAYGQSEQAREQVNRDYLTANPSNTALSKFGEMLPEIPLWLSGEKAVAMAGKGIVNSVPKLLPYAQKFGKLPGIVQGGLRDAATFGAIVAPSQALQQGTGFNGLLQNEKQLPGVLLGGIGVRGAGKLIGKGITTLKGRSIPNEVQTPPIEVPPLRMLPERPPLGITTPPQRNNVLDRFSTRADTRTPGTEIPQGPTMAARIEAPQSLVPRTTAELRPPLLRNEPAMAANIENPVIARTSVEIPVNTGVLPDTRLKERKFAENVRSSQIATPEIKANLDENKLMYTPISNKETFGKATDIVENDIKSAREMFDSPSKGVSADDVALGEALISKHIREGNNEEANKLIADLAEKLTAAGQAVQAASIFKRLSPEGMLMHARKAINGINKDAVTKQGSKASKVELTPADTKLITDKMKAAQQLPDGREKDVLIGEATQVIANKHPVTLGQKISTIQTMAQLLNPKTAIRNIGGNAGFGLGSENLSQIVGTGVDKVVGSFTGKRTVTLPSLKTQLKSGKAGFKLGVEDALKGINTSGLNTQMDLASSRTFKTGVLSKLETALNLELRAPDRAFYTAAYDDSLRSQLKAYNIKAVKKITEPTDEMKTIADTDGLYKTFQDKNALSDLFSTFKRKLNADKDFGVGDFIIKYAKTPATIIMRGIDYSPAGFIKAAYEASRPLMKQEFNQRAFVQAFSRATVGAGGLVGMGALLHKSGIITGARNADSDVAALQDSQGIGQFKINASALKRFVLAGFNPNASKLQEGDTLVSYDWFAPQAIPIAMGADINANGGKATGLVGTILSGLASGMNTLAEQPLTQGLQTLFGSGGASAAAVKMLEGVPASFVPTLLNQIKQLTDNQKRDTYSPNFIEKTTNLAKSKIPFLEKSLQPKYDVLGKPLETYKDKGNNAFNVFLNPAFVTKYTPSEQAKLAVDSYNETGETKQIPTVVPKYFTLSGTKFVLTSKEYSDIQKTVGEETNKAFGSISSTSNTDSQITAMTKAIEAARIKGKMQVLESRHISYTKSGSSLKLSK